MADDITHVHLLERIVKNEVTMEQVQREIKGLKGSLHDVKTAVYQNKDLATQITTKLNMIGWLIVVFLPAVTAVLGAVYILNGAG